jgi:nicotinate-nucleotide adenylyltransferase
VANRPELTTIGLFGGTFDPVHIGHLRLALELSQTLGFDQMRLVPCHLPPHRESPGCGSEQRATMVELAIQDCPQLSIDRRELSKPSASYTVETLAEMRAELGEEVSLSWCVGMDSLVNLSSWHRWRELLDYGHLVVVGRPGWQPPECGEVHDWLQDRLADGQIIRQRTHGSVIIEQLSMLPISATAIRQQLSQGQSPRFLLPDSVCQYIRQQQLYLSEENDN